MNNIMRRISLILSVVVFCIIVLASFGFLSTSNDIGNLLQEFSAVAQQRGLDSNITLDFQAVSLSLDSVEQIERIPNSSNVPIRVTLNDVSLASIDVAALTNVAGVDVLKFVNCEINSKYIHRIFLAHALSEIEFCDSRLTGFRQIESQRVWIAERVIVRCPNRHLSDFVFKNLGKANYLLVEYAESTELPSADFRYIEHLVLSNCVIPSKLTTGFENCENLRTVVLNETKIDSQILKAFLERPSLNVMSLDNCTLTNPNSDVVPTHLLEGKELHVSGSAEFCQAMHKMCGLECGEIKAVPVVSRNSNDPDGR